MHPGPSVFIHLPRVPVPFERRLRLCYDPGGYVGYGYGTSVTVYENGRTIGSPAG